MKEDIQTKRGDLTSEDFCSLMDMYRKERQSIRNVRDSERERLDQSLWAKLEQRRNMASDHGVHDSEGAQWELMGLHNGSMDGLVNEEGRRKVTKDANTSMGDTLTGSGVEVGVGTSVSVADSNVGTNGMAVEASQEVKMFISLTLIS